MAEVYTEPKEFKRYTLVPAPPKWELQEYIAAYFKEKDNKYLAWFLHYYENTLNTNVQKYMKQFFMPEHFTDIKQAYIMGMLKALENYDISIGAPFVIYKERYAEREVLDYIRSIRTGYTAQSLAEFAKLRKAMAIWDKYERSYTDETLKMIADEMGEETDAVKDILLSGLLNENAVELYRKYADEDGEEGTEEIVPDNSNNPSYLFFKSELYSCLWKAFDKLNYEEQSMFAQHFGFCLEWSFKKISVLAASFVLIIGLSITAVWILNKEPVQIAYDTNYSITISYENEQYGYYSNRYVIDKYGVEDISDLKQNPDLFTGSLTDSDIIHLDSVIDKESIIGAKIYPYSDDVLILQNNGRFYYFEKIETK